MSVTALAAVVQREPMYVIALPVIKIARPLMSRFSAESAHVQRPRWLFLAALRLWYSGLYAAFRCRLNRHCRHHVGQFRRGLADGTHVSAAKLDCRSGWRLRRQPLPRR